MSASFASAPPSLEAVADLALCPPPRLVLLRPLKELLDLDLELGLDLDGDLLCRPGKRSEPIWEQEVRAEILLPAHDAQFQG